MNWSLLTRLWCRLWHGPWQHYEAPANVDAFKCQTCSRIYFWRYAGVD